MIREMVIIEADGRVFTVDASVRLGSLHKIHAVREKGIQVEPIDFYSIGLFRYEIALEVIKQRSAQVGGKTQ